MLHVFYVSMSIVISVSDYFTFVGFTFSILFVWYSKPNSLPIISLTFYCVILYGASYILCLHVHISLFKLAFHSVTVTKCQIIMVEIVFLYPAKHPVQIPHNVYPLYNNHVHDNTQYTTGQQLWCIVVQGMKVNLINSYMVHDDQCIHVCNDWLFNVF